MSTTTDTIAEALDRACTAAGWKVEPAWPDGLAILVHPSLTIVTGLAGWDYGAAHALTDGAWEPVEVEGLGAGPAWDEPGDDLDAFAAGAVTAMRAYAAAFVAETCALAGADEVGLGYAGETPTAAEVAEVVTAPLDTPWLVALAATSAKCPECAGAYHDDEEAHVVHRDGIVLVGCEGFHTAILRTLVLRARAATVTR